MSNIDNQYANPSSIIHSVVVNTGFGEVILDRPNEAYFNSLIYGSYNLIINLISRVYLKISVYCVSLKNFTSQSGALLTNYAIYGKFKLGK